jgi:hypothetical protein
MSVPALGRVAMAAFNGQLYVAAQKPDQSLFIASSNDGSSFDLTELPQQSVGNCIAIRVLNDKLYIAYQDRASHSLVVVSSSEYFDAVEWRDIQLGSCAAMAVLRARVRRLLLVAANRKARSWRSQRLCRQPT